MDKTVKKKDTPSTIFVALFIATNAINLIATRALPVRENFMSVFYALTGFGIVISYLAAGGAHKLKMHVWHFFCVVIVVLYYLFTYLMFGKSSLSLSFFIVFVLLPLFIPMIAEIDTKLLLRIIFVIPSFGILRVQSIFLLTQKNTMTMGDCYALLIPIISALTYLMIFYKEDSKKTRLLLLPSIVVNFIYYLRIVLYG